MLNNTFFIFHFFFKILNAIYYYYFLGIQTLCQYMQYFAIYTFWLYIYMTITNLKRLILTSGEPLCGNWIVDTKVKVNHRSIKQSQQSNFNRLIICARVALLKRPLFPKLFTAVFTLNFRMTLWNGNIKKWKEEFSGSFVSFHYYYLSFN